MTERMRITAATIRAVRARVNETQEEFRKRLGVSKASIVKWERDGPPKRGAAHILLQYVIREIDQEYQ
jgi:DNA-binding transcriptional regulator YiaG